jgi:hypothetical protein
MLTHRRSPGASDEIAEAQTREAVSHGFRMIKVKIGPPVDKALARARLIREIVGSDMQLTADGNWAFDFDGSVRQARGLAVGLLRAESSEREWHLAGFGCQSPMTRGQKKRLRIFAWVRPEPLRHEWLVGKRGSLLTILL